MSRLLDIADMNRGNLCKFPGIVQVNRSDGVYRELPIGNGGKMTVVEGVSSICREEDLRPFVSKGLILQGSSSLEPVTVADKVSENSPVRTQGNCREHSAPFPSSQSAPDAVKSAKIVFGQSHVNAVQDQHINHDADTGRGRSYAAVVSNMKDSVNCKSQKTASAPSSKFAAAKTDCNRSFHDEGGFNSFGQIVEMDGRKVASFSVSELDELAAPFEFTLVGKFSHGFPTMKTLQSILVNLHFKGEFSTSLLEHKHVLFRFSCEEDYTRLWSRQIWHMAGFPMRVLKWTPDFDPLIEAPFAPVWVKFPYLPVHLFDKRSLFIIASVLGKPLRIDSATAALSRASTPRVCIEIDLSRTPLPEVEIHLGDKIRLQEVEYENIPAYCTFCHHIGHDLKVCKSVIQPSACPSLDTSLTRPLSGVPQSDPVMGSVMAVGQPVEVPASNQPPGSPLSPVLQSAPTPPADTILVSASGLLEFIPGSVDPILDRESADISIDDFSIGYERIMEIYGSSPAKRSCNHHDCGNVSDSFERRNYDRKDYGSDGDKVSGAVSIILPIKKLGAPKGKAQKKKRSDSANPVYVEYYSSSAPIKNDIGPSGGDDGFTVVGDKKKKKKGKEKKISSDLS